MAAGRAGAAAARREEREMAAHQKRLAKEKGRKRAALAEADRGAHASQIPWRMCHALEYQHKYQHQPVPLSF